ncbi:hypothetical protein [Paenibacillus sp. 37]|uniref:hypothetical protein n=1 Tax=Paenibacillus sp. 37 TaxID=2607911 RepID=UPI001CB768FE|nr:hypothetical protein [Paenibacillus sp. 37]
MKYSAELVGEISLFEIILDSTPKWIVGYVTDTLLWIYYKQDVLLFNIQVGLYI